MNNVTLRGKVRPSRLLHHLTSHKNTLKLILLNKQLQQNNSNKYIKQNFLYTNVKATERVTTILIRDKQK